MICVSVGRNPPALVSLSLTGSIFPNALSIVPVQTMAKNPFLTGGNNPGNSMFLQDGHIFFL